MNTKMMLALFAVALCSVAAFPSSDVDAIVPEVTSDAALVQQADSDSGTGSDSASWLLQSLAADADAVDTTESPENVIIDDANKLKVAMKVLAKKLPAEYASEKKKEEALTGDKVDPPQMAQRFCEQDDEGLKDRCAAYADERTAENMHAVLRQGLKQEEKQKNVDNTEMIKTSCANFAKKNDGNPGKAGNVLNAATPYMSCLCDEKNEGVLSYCVLMNTESFQKMIQVFEETGINEAQAKLLEASEGAGAGFKPSKMATKESLLSHPMFSELLQAFTATHPTETTATGRKKKLMDMLVEQHRGIHPEALTQKDICDIVSEKTAFDPVKVAKKLKFAMKATAGIFVCNGGCDVSGEVSITCEALKVLQVELALQVHPTPMVLTLKLKLCAPGLSDIIGELQEFEPIDNFLKDLGIHEGCLLLGTGALEPSMGWVTLRVSLPYNVWPFQLNFSTDSHINYDKDIDAHNKLCYAYMYKDRSSVLNAYMFGILDYVKCLTGKIPPPVSGWSVCARFTVSLRMFAVVKWEGILSHTEDWIYETSASSIGFESPKILVYGISGDDCGQAWIPKHMRIFVRDKIKGLQEGNCVEAGYSEQVGSKNIIYPGLGPIKILKYNKPQPKGEAMACKDPQYPHKIANVDVCFGSAAWRKRVNHEWVGCHTNGQPTWCNIPHAAKPGQGCSNPPTCKDPRPCKDPQYPHKHATVDVCYSNAAWQAGGKHGSVGCHTSGQPSWCNIPHAAKPGSGCWNPPTCKDAGPCKNPQYPHKHATVDVCYSNAAWQAGGKHGGVGCHTNGQPSWCNIPHAAKPGSGCWNPPTC